LGTLPPAGVTSRTLTPTDLGGEANSSRKTEEGERKLNIIRFSKPD